MTARRKTPRTPKEGKQKKLNRDHSLDVLRGTAVFFMILAHVNAVFYQQPGTILDTFTWWGVTICFSVFLFVSAAVTGIKAAKNQLDAERTLYRSVELMFVYFAMSITLIVIDPDILLSFGTYFKTLTFQHIPEYTEFLIPFFIYPVLVLPLRKYLGRVKDLVLPMVLGSLGIYFVAIGLYLLDWGGGYLDVIKGLLVGNGDWHRFGILPYMPLFAIGLIWGTMIDEKKEKKNGFARSTVLTSSAIFVFLALSRISEWNRYPPSILFLLYGILFSFGVILVYPFIKKDKIVHNALTFFGQNALAYYVYHIIFLIALSRVTDGVLLLEGGTAALYFVTFTLCTLFIYIGGRARKRLSSKV